MVGPVTSESQARECDITYFVWPIILDVNGLSRSKDVATCCVGYSIFYYYLLCISLRFSLCILWSVLALHRKQVVNANSWYEIFEILSSKHFSNYCSCSSNFYFSFFILLVYRTLKKIILNWIVFDSWVIIRMKSVYAKWTFGFIWFSICQKNWNLIKMITHWTENIERKQVINLF